jgi:UDP-N-acetylglucosamine pyrophosphorylase
MSLATVILAAGKGTRMKSDLPKVLHKINKKPLVHYVIEQANSVNSNPTVLIIGHEAELIKHETSNFNINYALQEQQLGTGHAVQQAEKALENFEGDVLILSGDVPLLTKETIKNLLDTHKSEKSIATVLTAHLDDPFGYGRLIRNESGTVNCIVEQKDASEEEQKVNEINTGIYLINKTELFSALANVKNENSQSEYYLPDVLPMFIAQGKKVIAYKTMNFNETRGINNPEQLKEAEEILLSR